MKGSATVQQALRKEVLQRIGPGAVKALHRPRGLRTLGTVAHVWAAIALCFWLGGLALNGPAAIALPMGLLAALFMATRINALNVLVHEGSHYTLAADRRWNSIITNCLAGYSILIDEDSYRALHMQHHRHLHEPGDPDLPLYRLERGPARLARGLLCDLLGISAVRRALVYAREGAAGAQQTRQRRHALGKLAVSLALLGAQVSVHGPLPGAAAYAAFWLVPLLCVYPAIIRMRTIAEHFSPEIFSEHGSPLFVARSTSCGPLEHYFLGAQMDYHFEHHLFPGIAYGELRTLHRALARTGLFTERIAREEHSETGGYMRFWRVLLRSPYLHGPGSGFEIGAVPAREATRTAAAVGEVRTETARCALCGADDREPIGSGRDFEYGTCTNEFTFVRCRHCDHVYLGNRPLPSELATIYPGNYGNYSAERTRALTFRFKSWLDRRTVARLARHGTAVRRVLDVGCADGRLLDVCARALPGVEQLRGIEISECAARAALAKGYRVTIGSLEELELPEKAYDLIFLQQVIEHLYAPERACAQLARSLAPGGLIVFETPTIEGADFRLLHRRYWGGYHIPRHYHLFSEKSLLQLCRAAGLQPVETRYTPQPVHWVWSLRHWLHERGFPEWTWRGLHIQNPLAMAVGTALELGAGLLFRRMSNMRVIAQRPA